MSFERYVALGDSTTEGLEDPYPDGSYRGWADRLARHLAAQNPDLTYANLAIRGRKLPQIRAEQLEPALALEPDLATILGGFNDIIRPSVDLAAIGADFDALVAGLRGAGATVLVMTYPDPTAVISLAAGRIRERVIAFNETILALRQGVVDGQENAVATVRMFGVWEVQKYMSINEHIYSPGLVITSADFWNGLTEPQRQIFKDGVFVWSTVSNSGYIANYDKDIQFLKDNGVEIYVNSAEEKELFKEAMQPPVVEFISERVGKDKVDAFIAAVEETRKEMYSADN